MNKKIVTQYTQADGWQLCEIPESTVVVEIDIDGGVGTTHPEAITAVRNGEIPVALRGDGDLGKPRIYIDEEWGGRGKPAVIIQADSAYHGSLFLRVGSDLDELLKWLDTYLTLIDTRSNPRHWREQKGAYSDRAITFTPYSEIELERIVRREQLWATLEPHLNRGDY